MFCKQLMVMCWNCLTTDLHSTAQCRRVTCLSTELLAMLGTAVSYNVVAGPPAEDVFATLRALLGRSLALRCFSMHSFDADRTLRRQLMDSALRLLAEGHVRAPQATVMALDQVQEVHRVLDAGGTMGKIVLTP